MGGAPANFAFHAAQLGARSLLVSRVGEDSAGLGLVHALESVGLSRKFVQAGSSRPTGSVEVDLAPDGSPRYSIQPNVAWDEIEFSPMLQQLAGRTNAVCFGSLAQRCHSSRDTIQRFLAASPRESLRIFDINLRPPHFTREVIEESLRLANVLKLNDEELAILAEFFALEGSVLQQVRALQADFELRLVALTCGGEGSWLVSATQEDFCKADPVVVVDTVGAGDAFTAAMAVGLLRGVPLSEVHASASAVAAFVCGKRGATPAHPR